MWRIERAEFEKGGRVRFGDDIRLKHLSSGFYLCIYTGEESTDMIKPRITQEVVAEESDDSKSEDGLKLEELEQDKLMY